MEAARRYNIYQKIKNNKAKVMQIFIVKKVVYTIHIYYYLYQFHISTHYSTAVTTLSWRGRPFCNFGERLIYHY